MVKKEVSSTLAYSRCAFPGLAEMVPSLFYPNFLFFGGRGVMLVGGKPTAGYEWDGDAAPAGMGWTAKAGRLPQQDTIVSPIIPGGEADTSLYLSSCTVIP